MRCVAVLLMGFAVHGAAQTTPSRRRSPAKPVASTAQSFLIGSLTVNGNDRIPSGVILLVAGLKIGDPVDKPLFEAARQRLIDTGFFDSVGYQYSPVVGARVSYAGKFEVTETKPVYAVQFAGLVQSKAELETFLKTRDPFYNGFGPPTNPVIDRWSRFLEAFEASKNIPQKVIGKLVSAANGDLRIQFQPEKAPPAVARVEFEGNKAIDGLMLANAIGAVAFGLPYTVQNFQDLLDHQIRPLYEQKGFLEVKFEGIETTPMPPPVQGLIVHVKVIEGAVYKLSSVKVSGVTQENRESLASTIKLKIDQTADFDEVTQAVQRVQTATRRAGYLRAKTSYDRALDENAKRVSVTIKVQPGERYHFGLLTVKGLDLNGDAMIRKLWGEKPGDAFNSEYPDRFLKRIREDDLFESLGDTTAALDANDETHIVNVTLTFVPGARKIEKKPEE